MQHKVFEKQLEDVRSETVRNLVIKSLDAISEKFFHAGASSTGKYHPDYTAGDGGLIRHTMSVEYFAKSFVKHLNISAYEKDCIISAAILHDLCKSGLNWENDYTAHDHPLLVFKLLDVSSMNKVEERAWRDVNNIIATHMGQWVTSTHSDIVLPRITNKAQMILHWADYLGSRKAVNVNHYGLNIDKPVFEESDSPAVEQLKDEIALISNADIKKMIRTALKSSLCDNLSNLSMKGNVPEWYKTKNGVIRKIKTSLFVANQLLTLEKTFVDEEDKNIIYASLFFKELGECFKMADLQGAQVVYWSNIYAIIFDDNYNSWEKMIVDVCNEISMDSTIEINYMKVEEKTFKPASEKQINYLKVLIEKIQGKDDYDGAYDDIKFDKLSSGQAGQYITTLKSLV